jgi:hypothetical protein
MPGDQAVLRLKLAFVLKLVNQHRLGHAVLLDRVGEQPVFGIVFRVEFLTGPQSRAGR